MTKNNDVDADLTKVIGKASTLTLSKNGKVGDGVFGKGQRRGSGGFSIS